MAEKDRISAEAANIEHKRSTSHRSDCRNQIGGNTSSCRYVSVVQLRCLPNALTGDEDPSSRRTGKITCIVLHTATRFIR